MNFRLHKKSVIYSSSIENQLKISNMYCKYYSQGIYFLYPKTFALFYRLYITLKMLITICSGKHVNSKHKENYSCYLDKDYYLVYLKKSISSYYFEVLLQKCKIQKSKNTLFYFIGIWRN